MITNGNELFEYAERNQKLLSMNYLKNISITIRLTNQNISAVEFLNSKTIHYMKKLLWSMRTATRLD